MIWFSDSLLCARAHCLVLQARDLVFCVPLGSLFGFQAHCLVFGLTKMFCDHGALQFTIQFFGSLFGFWAHHFAFGLTVWFCENNFVSDFGARATHRS